MRQYVWGTQYVDEIVRVDLNSDYTDQEHSTIGWGGSCREIHWTLLLSSTCSQMQAFRVPLCSAKGPILTRYGKILHAMQDRTSHMDGTAVPGNIENDHQASTPLRHIGILSLVARGLNWGNPHRPDNAGLFAEAFAYTAGLTYDALYDALPNWSGPPCCCANPLSIPR